MAAGAAVGFSSGFSCAKDVSEAVNAAAIVKTNDARRLRMGKTMEGNLFEFWMNLSVRDVWFV